MPSMTTSMLYKFESIVLITLYVQNGLSNPNYVTAREIVMYI